MIRPVLSNHRSIAFVLAAYLVLTSVYSVTTPLFEAPDEQWHYAYVQYIAQGRGLPVQTLNDPDHLARQEASQPPLFYLLAAGATFWINPADFPAIIWENPHYGYNVPGVVNDNKNLFIHTALEGFPYHDAALAIHLARFISILFGGLAVFGTYLLASEIFRGQNWQAASAAAFVAFVPQFIFVSSAVSNDSAIVAMTAISLWLMARIFFVRPRFRDTIALSAAAGLAALAKVSGLGVVFLAAFALIIVHRKNLRVLLIHLSLLAFAFLSVSGWWYARNWILYGELTGTETMLRVFGERGALLTLQQLTTQFGEVWETFWIGFGWGNVRAPSFIYAFFAIFMALAIVGWIVAITTSYNVMPSEARHRASNLKIQSDSRYSSFALLTHNHKVVFLLLALWIVLTFTALLRWMEVTQAPHGRLFFPVLPALAPLVIFGLVTLSRQCSQFIIAYALPLAMFLLALYALIAILRPAYAFPLSLTAANSDKIPNRLNITYDGKMKLLGYDVSPQRAFPDGSVELSLYWQSLVQMDEDYSIAIALLDSNRDVLSQRNSYPGHGLFPTRLWRVGQMIRDAYWLPIPINARAPSVAQIQVSLFRREDKRDLAALDPAGNAVTPIIGRFKIASAHPIEVHPQKQTDFTFGNQVALIGYDVEKPSSGLNLTLYWRRVTQMKVDYTVFVHVLDMNDKIVMQKDSQPAAGSNPTSFWDAGEIVVDRYSFSSLERGAYRIRVGLYRLEIGERLIVGNGLGDNVTLGSIEVEQ